MRLKRGILPEPRRAAVETACNAAGDAIKPVVRAIVVAKPRLKYTLKGPNLRSVLFLTFPGNFLVVNRRNLKVVPQPKTCSIGKPSKFDECGNPQRTRATI